MRDKIEDIREGLEIVESKVKGAMRYMKRGKAMGSDGIAMKMLHATGKMGVKSISKIVNNDYHSGQIKKRKNNSFFCNTEN